jgi:copper chaperone CopZ
MSKKLLSNLGLRAILAEVARRQRLASRLRRVKARLRKKLSAVEKQLATLDGSRAPARRAPARRVRNKIKLADVMARVMTKDQPISVAQIAQAVTKAGYKSSSKTFHTIIYQTLARDKRFKKARRGRYALR